MLAAQEFIPLLGAAIPRFGQYPPNPGQEHCILHAPGTPLMIVAGPGAGKTTVLVLRALRLVFVDDLLPEQVVLTTFTKKAADEIRARLIEWGQALKEHLTQHPPVGAGPSFADALERIDINRFVTGTLDSFCEDALTRYRDPQDSPVVVVEGFVADAALLSDGIFASGAGQNPDLDAFQARFTFDGKSPANVGEKLRTSRTLIDRFVHDQVDLQAYSTSTDATAARSAMKEVAEGYWAGLQTASRLDFAVLEQTFLERLRSGHLHRLTESIRAVLVDEYQDTNPLQESIYLELVRLSGASYSIVGDDDQSLYRFRGATIELFRDFIDRFTAALPSVPVPHKADLVENYRSTPEIVEFFNRFITTDPAFSAARVQPPKPLIVPRVAANGLPVLGLFRPDADTLASALSAFLHSVFRGGGYDLPGGGGLRIVGPPDADFGDAVVLGHTVNEYASSFMGKPPRARFPRLLREHLAQAGTSVFNPRGRALRDIPEVGVLLGLIAECIDPNATIQASMLLRSEAVRYLADWRAAARTFLGSNPAPSQPHGLPEFVAAWQARTPQGAMVWPDEWPILELCFKLICWFPLFQDDPEGQIYLEAITRTIAQAATFSSYGSTIVHGRPPHDENSARSAIRDILAPIAEGAIEVDEDIMPSVPRDRLTFMTIHQAKGLEFPLVIVDVSSDYQRNSPQQRFRRFPDGPGNVQHAEDDLAPFAAIGPLRMARTALERTFDDLVRLYYVAYSRPESVLLLVGLDKCLQYRTSIQHVATGWRSDGSWTWSSPVLGKPPPLANAIPLTLI